ncbi:MULTISPECIES: DNA-binding protein [Mameliella]|uniref:DNA-binding protein n=1 Tax=Mameliella TaxID=1434019 RepID=UPI000B52EE21|nr:MULTISPECIES: DNA-binding protein [Mameliella]MCR9272543.1 DNA-binding protein [Paracoccaceae bacterium]OWV60391.1 hypothetical protein CDZ98_11270 [Mameliella alba]
MSVKTGQKLFENPTKWPLLPPWWLLPRPQAAALLNVTSATMRNWRIRGEGPPQVPPMYLRPTQGDPAYYRYADIREWAASRVGLQYAFEDQCRDFFEQIFPNLAGGTDQMKGRAWTFDRIYREDRDRLRSGRKTWYLSQETIEALDLHFSRQPVCLK